MKPVYFFLATLIVGVSMAAADPTTMPTPPQNASVLLIPFKQVGEASSHQWVSAAIQENLLTAAATSGDQTIAMDRPLSLADASEALRVAHEYGAMAVVYGSYQFSGGELRVNGQVTDVASGHVVGTLQAGGAVIDLFKIEDALAAQLRPLLPMTANSQPQVLYGSNPTDSAPSEVATADTSNQIQQVYPNTAGDQQQPTVVAPYQYPYASSDSGYVYPYDNSYAYGSAYPSYGYGWGYPYVVIGGGYGGFYGRGYYPWRSGGGRGWVGIYGNSAGGFGFRGGTAFHGGGGVGFAARSGGGFSGGGHGR
jgi:TolB-like protein